MRTGIYFILCMLFLMPVSGGCIGGHDNFQAAEMQAGDTVNENRTELFLKSESDDTPASEPLTYEYETRELYVNRDGKRIYGILYVPQDAGEIMPAVIVSHGFGGNYQVGAQYAQALAAKGYAV